MAWAKIDDQFADHPKVIAAGPMASWLYVCGLTYCARLLTDGFIPTGQVRKLADLDRALDLAQILVGVGLWQEVAGGYLVHDYLEYNPSRERVLATREVRAQAGSRGGKQKASNLLDVSLPVATDNVVAKSYPVPHPVPHPDPDPTNAVAVAEVGGTGGGDESPQPGEPAASPPRARNSSRATGRAAVTENVTARPTADTFVPDVALLEWAKRAFPEIDASAETERFLDWTRANGKRWKDWPAAWKNWMRRADDMQPVGRRGVTATTEAGKERGDGHDGHRAGGGAGAGAAGPRRGGAAARPGATGGHRTYRDDDLWTQDFRPKE